MTFITMFFLAWSSLVFAPLAAFTSGGSNDWGTSTDSDSIWIWATTGTSSLSPPVSWTIGDSAPPPPKTGLARCWEVSAATGDPLVAECEGFFWIAGADGPELLEHGSPGKPEPGVNIPVPTPRELIEYATATVKAQGSGLRVQPDGDVLATIPTLVHAQSPAQTLTTEIFGTPVTVTLTATRFSYDFGDGSSPLVTSDPGEPYPSRRLSHTYIERADNVTITLTTTWRGSVTSPFTGESAAIDGVVITTETSNPFNIRKANIALIDDDY